MENEYLKLRSAEAKFIFRSGICHLKLSGEIDMSCYSSLTDFLKKHRFKTRQCPVIFDLAGVTFMDSTGGLRLLMEMADRLGLDRVAVIHANENIKRLFQVANMTRFVTVYSDIDQATRALSANACESQGFEKSA